MIVKRVCSFLRFTRLIACSGILIGMFTQSAAAASIGIYQDFGKLSLNNVKSIDYEIETGVTDSDVAVIAIHGGKIEEGTSELAYALSFRNNYNYYSHKGIKSKDNLSLHISSEKFDEPIALEMVAKSKTTLSLHGCSGPQEFTYVGGLDNELRNKIKESLTRYGFTALDAPRGLAGRSPENIVNKNARGSGVQLEISAGLRARFLSGDGGKLSSYVLAISEAINSTPESIAEGKN